MSGNQVAYIVARRDQAGSVFHLGRLAGRNVVAVQVSRNDSTGTTPSGTTAYGGIVTLINTAGTGYLQHG